VDHSRLSPSPRNLPSSSSLSGSQARQGHSHRRSPTAPEAPTTSEMLGPLGSGKLGRTWVAGDESEFGGESEREKSRERERERDAAKGASRQQPPPRPTSIPVLPPAQVVAAAAPVASRQLYVRILIFILSALRLYTYVDVLPFAGEQKSLCTPGYDR
jgi:hypothetical protein